MVALIPLPLISVANSVVESNASFSATERGAVFELQLLFSVVFLSHQVFSEDIFLVQVCNFLAQILNRNHSIFLRWEEYSSFPRRVPPTSPPPPSVSHFFPIPPPPPPARRESSVPPWSSWKEMPLVWDLPTAFADKIIGMSESNTHIRSISKHRHWQIPCGS